MEMKECSVQKLYQNSVSIEWNNKGQKEEKLFKHIIREYLYSWDNKVVEDTLMEAYQR